MRYMCRSHIQLLAIIKTKMKNTGLAIIFSLTLMSCDSQNQETKIETQVKKNKSESWKLDNYIDSDQSHSFSESIFQPVSLRVNRQFHQIEIYND